VRVKLVGCDVQITLTVESEDEAAAMAGKMSAQLQSGHGMTLVVEPKNQGSLH
jgi:hypothetical protein